MSTEILTVKDLVTRNAAERGDIPFLEFYDEVVTCRDLDERSDAFARYLLSKGIGKGDIVAFMMGNSPSFFYVLLGAQKIGAIAGPVSCWWQDKELQHLVDDAEPPMLIVDDEFVPIVSKIKDTMASVKTIVVNSPSKLSLDFEHEHLPEVLEAHAGKLEHDDPPTAEDVATAMYTSGTTGKPKGVLHTHCNILSATHSKVQIAPIEPGDRSLCVLPLFHSGGLNVYPKELETVIGAHPAVEEVAVIPEPHDKYGQVAKACVVIRQGKSLTEEELRTHCASELAPYKVPEKFLFVDRLPRNAIGKVLKKELIREIAEEATAEAVPVAHLFEGMVARFIPKKAKGVDAVISYHITGAGGGDWTVTIRDNQISVTEGLAEDPRCYVVARDRDYYAVTVGKMSGITAVITGKMSIKGDTGFMRKLRKMFKPVESK